MTASVGSSSPEDQVAGSGTRPMPLRPLDRLPSIRSKLGAVIVFAVAATILIMYVAIGFTLRQSERYRQLAELGDETRTVAAVGFSSSGVPTRALTRVVNGYGRPAVVVLADSRVLFAQFPVPATLDQTLSGRTDTGTVGSVEYVGIPVFRQGRVVAAVYLAHQVEGGSLIGAVRATATFVRSVWWQLLLAGAVAAIIALGLARWLARGMTQPIRDVAAAAERLGRGEYRERVPVTSRDELGRLAGTFNQMAAELEKVERLRRDLVANVSHELKTPIAAIRAHLENLLDGVEEPNRVTLAVMLEQSERLSRLVEELLDLSRLESGDVPLELEPVPLAALVDRVMTEIQVGRPDHAVALLNEVPRDLRPLLADRERMHQVLFNLLDNALRFTPPGGSVTVGAVQTDAQCEVWVEDTGPGIPEEHLPLVFERFYRVDRSRSRGDGGTGIGLTIARSVVEAHGGRIWVEPGPSGGSRFRFVLPGTPGPTGRATQDDRSREPQRGPEERRTHRAGAPVETAVPVGTPPISRVKEAS